MNRKIYFDYEFILFLYAYFRQADLSLDRSKWTDWEELQGYYQQQIAPGKVAVLLLEKANIQDSELREVSAVRPIRVTQWRQFRRFISWKASLGNFLTEEQVMFCYRQLKTLEAYLDRHFEEYYDQERLRVNICSIAYEVLEYKLSLRDSLAAEKITHYFQNETLNTHPMEMFSQGIL